MICNMIYVVFPHQIHLNYLDNEGIFGQITISCQTDHKKIAAFRPRPVVMRRKKTPKRR